ncbi:MAG TPA: acetyl-CoA carboxylase [Gaiellaceae bacterium]|nr:acetyl-CoA carboxylase [Gaiellaceae bacterium]
MQQTVKSALPGTFYRRPAPAAEPYVGEGDTVQPGDVVGMIEIMKTFYEVTSDAAGIVVRFLVENEALVEAGQDVLVLETAP